MSQENVDFLAGLFGAADSLDKDAMLAALPTLIEQACDPDIEWVKIHNAPTGTSTGGTRAFASPGSDGLRTLTPTDSRSSESPTTATGCW